jgi:hypothetical protein
MVARVDDIPFKEKILEISPNADKQQRLRQRHQARKLVK